MAVDVKTLTIEKVKTWMTTVDGIVRNTELFDGDHWLDGEGWTGPMLSINDPEYDDYKKRIKRGFVSQNVIKEITERHTSGVIGREADWGFTTLDEETAETDPDTEESEDEEAAQEAARELTIWWDERAAHTRLQRLTEKLLLCERVSMKLTIPPDLFEETEGGDTRLPDMDFREAVMNLYPEVVGPEEGGVYTDPDSMKQYGYYVGKDANDVEYAEISYLNDDGLTVIARIDRYDGENRISESDAIDLDGQLHIYQIERPLFITQQIREQQYAVNKAYTMLNTNLDWSQFLERIFLNAQRPVEIKRDKDGRVMRDDRGEAMYENAEYVTGPSQTAWLTGVQTEDNEGNLTVATPQVVFREPLDPEKFQKSADYAYRACLKEARQVHAMIAGDATASGDSRRQAMSDFLISLLPTKSVLDRLGRWMIATVREFARALSKSGGEVRLRASFSCRLDLGPVPEDEVRLIIERAKARLLSTETALTLTGVEDPDAEIQRIRDDINNRLELEKMLASVISQYTGGGVPLSNAVRHIFEMAGYEDERVTQLLTVTGPEGNPDDAPVPANTNGSPGS